MEKQIDARDKVLPELKNFIIPQGNFSAAQAHFARTVCRRTEREIVKLSHSEKLDNNIIVYLNRLSDYLFIVARMENFRKKIKEKIWKI